MSFGNDPMAAFDDALGDDSSTGTRITLPESYYPVAVTVSEYGTNARLEVPELKLNLVVTEGPFGGVEVGRYDSAILLSSGKEDGTGREIGRVRHMVKAVTGLLPDSSALHDFGFAFSGNPSLAVQEFHEHFNALDADTKTAFMAKYARVKAWDGKQAIVYLRIRDYVSQDGTPRSSNRIGNFFAVNDAKNGMAVVRSVHFPLQEKAKVAMAAGATTV